MKRVEISGLAGLMVIVSILSLAYLRHGILILAGYLVFVIIITLTWKQYMLNVFSFIMLFHLAQVITYILTAHGTAT